MFWKSFRNELIGVAVCYLTGAFMGFITAPIMDSAEDNQLALGDNTQISSRGEWIALAWGAGMLYIIFINICTLYHMIFMLFI